MPIITVLLLVAILVSIIPSSLALTDTGPIATDPRTSHLRAGAAAGFAAYPTTEETTITMATPENLSVFHFDLKFPGPHMLRVFLDEKQALELIAELSRMLTSNPPDDICLVRFGELWRDAEEDSGVKLETK